MASKNTQSPAVDPTQIIDPAIELTLDEFCTRLSQRDPRVELIGGFHFTARTAGQIKDTEAGFQARFDEFVNKPV